MKTDPLFQPKKGDPPAIRLLKAIFREGEKRDRKMMAELQAEPETEADDGKSGRLSNAIAYTCARRLDPVNV